MKLATWNVNSLNVRMPQVPDWLKPQSAQVSIDVLALQETKLTDDPHKSLHGYELIHGAYCLNFLNTVY
jgi:exodeoxyribonuclease-3